MEALQILVEPPEGLPEVDREYYVMQGEMYTGRPHGAIHTEARNACGGPPTALCNAEQLRDRIAYLRHW